MGHVVVVVVFSMSLALVLMQTNGINNMQHVRFISHKRIHVVIKLNGQNHRTKREKEIVAKDHKTTIIKNIVCKKTAGIKYAHLKKRKKCKVKQPL